LKETNERLRHASTCDTRKRGIAYQPRGARRRSLDSIAPMWHRSLCLGGGITGATWL